MPFSQNRVDLKALRMEQLPRPSLEEFGAALGMLRRPWCAHRICGFLTKGGRVDVIDLMHGKVSPGFTYCNWCLWAKDIPRGSTVTGHLAQHLEVLFSIPLVQVRIIDWFQFNGRQTRRRTYQVPLSPYSFQSIGYIGSTYFPPFFSGRSPESAYSFWHRSRRSRQFPSSSETSRFRLGHRWQTHSCSKALRSLTGRQPGMPWQVFLHLQEPVRSQRSPGRRRLAWSFHC